MEASWATITVAVADLDHWEHLLGPLDVVERNRRTARIEVESVPYGGADVWAEAASACLVFVGAACGRQGAYEAFRFASGGNGELVTCPADDEGRIIVRMDEDGRLCSGDLRAADRLRATDARARSVLGLPKGRRP